MALVAVPEDEGRVGLDHLEGVFALSWLGHLGGVSHCFRSVDKVATHCELRCGGWTDVTVLRERLCFIDLVRRSPDSFWKRCS